MILRRLSQSFREQNWMAIGIEFVLLVAGVFLGIQVSNPRLQGATGGVRLALAAAGDHRVPTSQ